MDKDIALVVNIEVQPGKREDQISAFNKLVPLVLAEPGCIQYELRAVANNENQFVLLEKWSSEEALAAHEIIKLLTI